MSSNIIKGEIQQQFAKKYLAYALSTITQRALPDVRDGLKPVHRRLLYAMYLLNLSPKSQFKKSARVVGDVIGKFHPHGDQSVYDALVRLAQDFSTRYTLIEGQGNFGNIDGDNAAAMRYTETKLTKISEFILSGIEEDTVKFKKTYDGELDEPEILPSQFPNILANGSSGIAVGMATSIPPHNVNEVCQALIHLNDNPGCSIRELLKFIKGPDFPTGGILNDDKKEIFKAYNTGRGFFEIKSKYKVEDLGRGLYQIVVTEIPYAVNKSKLIEKIANIIINKKNKLLEHVSDESDESIRIVLRPRNRNVNPDDLMNSLFEQTELKNKSFLNMNVLNEKKEPQIMNLKDILKALLKHRYNILNNRLRFQLNKIKKRLEILKGFLIVYKNLNRIIKIIRNSKDPKKELVKKFKFSVIQVEAILEMRLRNLKKIEENEIKQEFKALEYEKKRLIKILNSKSLQRKEVNKEYEEVIYQFGDNSKFGKRKSILEKFEVFTDDELVSKLEVVENINISLINNQFLKAKKGHYKISDIKNDNNSNLILNCKTTDHLCLISNIGKSYVLDGRILKFGSIKGVAISTYIKLSENEKIIDIFKYSEKSKVVLASKDGFAFSINLIDLYSNKRSGKKIFNIKKNDQFKTSCLVDKNKDNFIGVFLKKDQDIKLLIFKIKELPNLQKGSGVICFKSKGYKTSSIHALEDDLMFYDYYKNKLQLNKNLKNYLSKRGKAGKPIKIKNIRISRGFDNNFVL
tara:strand:+ start:45 stop:2282 length:2238 start_codon:yes stop_codon:yes gene_type:complete